MPSYPSLPLLARLRSATRPARRKSAAAAVIVQRRFLCPHVRAIAVTGSVGKTSTTFIVRQLLANRGRVHFRGRYNGPISVRRMVLSLRPWHRYFVQEVSAWPLGSMDESIAMIRPQVAIVTCIGDDHCSTFQTRKATALEKSKIVSRLRPQDMAILNFDDPLVRAMADVTDAKVLSYGTAAEADLRASEITSSWPDGLSMTVTCKGESARIQTRFIGTHWVTAMLAAIGCALSEGISLRECAALLATFDPPFGTVSQHTTPDGVHFIADTHKAPAWNNGAAVDVVREARAARKIVVVGNIAHIEKNTRQTCREVARAFLDVAEIVVFVGKQSDYVSPLKKEYGPERLHTVETLQELRKTMLTLTRPGDLIYMRSDTKLPLEQLVLERIEQRRAG